MVSWACGEEHLDLCEQLVIFAGYGPVRFVLLVDIVSASVLTPGSDTLKCQGWKKSRTGKSTVCHAYLCISTVHVSYFVSRLSQARQGTPVMDSIMIELGTYLGTQTMQTKAHNQNVF
jgi:hypothetical protein